jgi:hypothetical protein
VLQRIVQVDERDVQLLPEALIQRAAALEYARLMERVRAKSAMNLL